MRVLVPSEAFLARGLKTHEETRGERREIFTHLETEFYEYTFFFIVIIVAIKGHEARVMVRLVTRETVNTAVKMLA